ncbi:MAG TPA: hypothetical protein VGV14_19085 [Rhodanobacter sp.]|nr:hypothetical protein [Rhodanobacter sp.]
MSLHPIMAQALKPFRLNPPTAREKLDELLRTPFELDDGERSGVADESDVYRAVDECVERHMDEIEARVVALTMERAA